MFSGHLPYGYKISEFVRQFDIGNHFLLAHVGIVDEDVCHSPFHPVPTLCLAALMRGIKLFLRPRVNAVFHEKVVRRVNCDAFPCALTFRADFPRKERFSRTRQATQQYQLVLVLNI